MATECCNGVMRAIGQVKSRHLGNSVINELNGAKKQLEFVAQFLNHLEQHSRDNELSAQLKVLFKEARNDFYEIWCHMNDQGRTEVTIRMISEVLKKIKPASIARLIADSKPSRSTIKITVELIGFVDALLETVRFVLNCWKDFIARSFTKNEVLEKKLISVRFLLIIAYYCCIDEYEIVSEMLTHAADVAYTAAGLVISSLDPACVMNSEFSEFLETINPISPELRRIYMSVFKGRSKSSGSETPMIAQLVEGFLCTLQEGLEELLSRDASLQVAFEDHMQWFQEGLIYLSSFLLNLPTSYIEDQKLCSLPSHIEALACEAGILVYSLYDEDVDETTLFPLQVKFIHVMIEGDLIMLQEATMMALLKDLIDNVLEKLIFLRTFLMDSLEQCIHQAETTDVLSLVQHVTTEAGSVIKSLSHISEQGDLAREITIVYYQFLLKFDFINAVIKQICPINSASSTPDNPMIKLLDFLPVNFEVIDFYVSVLKSSRPSSFGSLTFFEVLMGFLEYILNHLLELLNDEGSFIVTATNEVKNFHQGLLLLVTHFIEKQMQYIECNGETDHLAEIGKIAFEAESAVSSLCEEDSVDEATGIDHVLFPLQVKLRLVNVESNLIELLENETTMMAPLKDLIVNVTEELIFWRSFLMDSLEQSERRTPKSLPFPLQIKLNHVKVESSLIKLLNDEVTMMPPLKDLIEDVQEELTFLRNFLMDLLEQCQEQSKITDVLTMVQSVTTEAGSLIHPLHFNSKQGDLAREINLLHFQLLLMFKFIKTVIRHMISIISASTAAEHPLINLLNFIPISFEITCSFFSVLKSRKMSSLGSPKMDEDVMVFLDYILNNLRVILNDEANLIFTVTDGVKKFYQALLLIVTFIADPPNQYLECKKRNVLLTKVETIAVEAESGVRSSTKLHDVLLPLQQKLNHVLAESSLTKPLLKHNMMAPLKDLIINVKGELMFFQTSHRPLPLQVKLNHFKVESSLIELLKHEDTMTAPLKDLIHNVQEELIFLRAFLMDSLERCKGQTKLNDVLTLVQSVTADAGSFINSLSHNSRQGSLAWEINLLHFGLLLKFKFIKRAIGQMCPVTSASILSDTTINLLKFIPISFEVINYYFSELKFSKTSSIGIPRMDELLMGFLEFMLENLNKLLKDEAKLVFTVGNEVKKFYQGLLLIEIFLADPPTECKKQLYLLTVIENIALEAETAVTSCYEGASVDCVLFTLLVKLNQVKLERSLIKLQNCKATRMAPLNDLIENVQKELIFLRTFLMDSSEQCKENSKITDVLALVQSVTTEAASVVNSLCCNPKQGCLAKEINLSHFQLLLKLKFIKAVIRQMCPIASASSTSNHLMINLLNSFPIDFEVIDFYFSMLKSSKTSSLGSQKMDEILIGFHEYILDNLEELSNGGASFLFTDTEKRFYQGLLLLVTFLVDPPIQYVECKKQNDLLTEIETILLEAKSVICICSSCADAVNSYGSRKVNHELQLLTAAYKLIKSERNLTRLLMHKTTLESQIVVLIENTYEELIFLRAFLVNLLRQHTDLNKLQDLLLHAEVTAHKAALISGSRYESFTDGSNSEEMSLSLVELLREIKSFKLEIRSMYFHDLDASPGDMITTDVEGLLKFLLNNLDRVLKYDDCSISFLKNQLPDVQKRLVCLISFLTEIVQHRNIHKQLKDLADHVQEAVNGSRNVIFFSVGCDNPVWHHLLYLSDVKEVLKFVEAEIRKICLEVPHLPLFGFSKTNGLGFLNCFLEKLEEVLQSNTNLITELKHQIGSVNEELKHLKSFINCSAEKDGEHNRLVTSAIEEAYKAEYVIDSCLSISLPLWYKFHWISEVVENIKHVNNDFREISKKEKIDMTVHEVAKTSTSRVPSLSENEELVLFQDVMETIKKQLFDRSSQLDVISIVGMPGLGKTTLAKQIYNDPMVGRYFDVRGKCQVTQEYSWKELLLAILNDVKPTGRTAKEDPELANELHSILLEKRSLILIDDLWDTKAWDDLHMCFQGVQNGSRIILTTRLSEVAHHAKCKSNPHDLSLLKDEESWKLLQEKVFHGESCPPDLRDVGFRIAKICGGLPLFIVLVAGVLIEKNDKADLWTEVEESLYSQNTGMLKESMPIIGFSYMSLPPHLQACFLYFGGFLRGKDIHVSKLKRLWLAEGFIQESKEKRREDVAQDFLEKLISRNLVVDVDRRFNGKLKTCRVHDLLHKFCLEKAKLEKFLLWIYRDKDADADHIYPDKPVEYRLSIYSGRDEFAQWRPPRSSIRSLLFNATSKDPYTTTERDLSFILNSFKLIKVLDLETINIGDTFPREILSLIHMRYFAAGTKAVSIPSSIDKLWNLETFIIKGLQGGLTLPCSLLKVEKLRHIHASDSVSFEIDDNMSESLANAKLANVQTFSTPRLSFDDTEILRYMPNLRKLRCLVDSYHPRLDFLSHLQSLKLFSNRYRLTGFDIPSGVRELTLSKLGLPWSTISTIGTFCNLEVLKLLDGAFKGDQWEVKDSEFPELKYLKLQDLDIKLWSVCDDAFPSLERLVLTGCKKLKEIPSHFEDIVPLKSIEVSWCSSTVPESAQEIETTRRETLGKCVFKVTIEPPDLGTRAPPAKPFRFLKRGGGKKADGIHRLWINNRSSRWNPWPLD